MRYRRNEIKKCYEDKVKLADGNFCNHEMCFGNHQVAECLHCEPTVNYFLRCKTDVYGGTGCVCVSHSKATPAAGLLTVILVPLIVVIFFIGIIIHHWVNGIKSLSGKVHFCTFFESEQNTKAQQIFYFNYLFKLQKIDFTGRFYLKNAPLDLSFKDREFFRFIPFPISRKTTFAKNL